ncbi:MAG: NrfD/PsrC family molybdoenzyme membrane anchor subunit, partial [Ignavibacteria bacterium]|nr:NrfD/PsrC family molybdoenzyme membrane anchor subunit [Ignavibacteria bacterium]
MKSENIHIEEINGTNDSKDELKNLSYSEINQKISGLINKKSSFKYWSALGFSFILTLVGVVAVYQTITKGLTVWGIHNNVSWGVAIVTFVFWIGIGHAGTLISAILYIFNQKWRIAIHRSAEAMTIIAVICAAIFPIIHTGRPWFALYWLFPYPNQMGMWVNFNSPLLWDVFAIVTYFILSICFWYLGLIPDFAVLKKHVRIKATGKLYDFFSLGWTGTQREWQAYKATYLLLAGIATALVISVHSIVSTDFAVTVIPGWHSTIFPPYFVAGAILSGCAMVVAILIITRQILTLKGFITISHFDKLNKIIIATSLMIGYSYAVEIFFIWYSGSSAEMMMLKARATGGYALLFYLMIAFNVIIPQVLWIRKLRTNI